MIIKELNLIGFGKFENKIIHLEDGINIIYGENEQGKTTIHNFINGMFYGFLKPYVKRTIYLDEHEKYNPWNNSKYSGIIKFSYNGEDYQIQREFTKNNEDTKVILDATGEDITNSIDNGNSGRVLQPGNHFFGFNDGVYSNTISIKQLQNETEELLANEVRDKLVNMSTSLDDQLSVENAVISLEKALKDIGTTRASKSLYGSIYEKLNKDKSKKEEILKYKSEYERVLQENKDLEKELKKQAKKLEILKSNLKKSEIIYKNGIYEEAAKLEKEIKEIEDNIDLYKKYKDIDSKAYLDGIQINDRIENKKERISEYEENLRKEFHKKNLLEFQNRSNSNEQEIADKYMEYEKLEEEKENLDDRNNENHLEFLKRDFDQNKKSKDKYQSTLRITIFVLIGSIVGSIFLRNYLFLAINFIGIPLGIISIIRFKEKKEIVNKLKKEIILGQETKNSNKKLILDIEKKQREILNSLDLASKSEFKILQQKIQHQIYKRQDKKENLEIIDREIEIIQDNILKLKQSLNDDSKKLRDIFINNLSNNLKELEKNIEYKKLYEDSFLSFKNKKEILNKVLKNHSIEDLKFTIDSYKEKISDTDGIKSVEEIKKDINKKIEEISNTKIRESALKENLNYLNNKIDTLVEIEESLSKNKRKLSLLDKKRQSIELAMDTLKGLSKNIHKEFAPKLNDTVGSIVEDITGGKYINVKVNDKLELGVIRPDTSEITDIKSLSGGTIDQLYFALRFGIIDSLNRKTLPLILDDCFIQYDDNRLENIIKFLIKESKNRQIILFTCHKRELSILNKLKFKFNLVHLS